MHNHGEHVSRNAGQVMQYFIGLEEYTYKDVLDRFLFTILQYHSGANKLDAMTRQIILTSEGKHEAAKKDLDEHDSDINVNKSGTSEKNASSSSSNIAGETEPRKVATDEKPKGSKVVLIVDATVADQMIAYPTDLGPLSKSREESERLINEMFKTININDKPRTYRQLARKQYLNVAKKKTKQGTNLTKP